VRKCDVLVAMNQAAFDKNKKDVKENGILIAEEDVVAKADDVKARVFHVPATRTAEAELKSKMYANVVMLGALTKITPLVSNKAMEKAIVDSVPNEVKQKNLNAFRLGFQLIKQ
jgi:2-oxoglutarate ferredoxin oxidoreductase subunit gamma